MKSLVALICLMSIFSTLAANASETSKDASIICGKDRIANNVYEQFVGNVQSLTMPYTALYQTVSKEVEAEFNQRCATMENANEIRMQTFNVACEASCLKNTPSFFQDDLLFKKSKIKDLSKECISICNMANTFVYGYISGANSERASK